MNKTKCTKCGDLFPKNYIENVVTWRGAIEAIRGSAPFCLDCASEVKAEEDEIRDRDWHGEDWKEGYDPDDDEEERWKDQ